MADFDFLDGFEEGGDWGFSSVAEKPSEKTQSDSETTKAVVKQTADGVGKAVSKEVAEVAEECGLQFGFTMWRGINNFENLENKFLLNRIDTNDAPGGKLKRTNFIPN